MRSTIESLSALKIGSASPRRLARESPLPKRKSRRKIPTACINYFRTEQAEEVARQIPNYDPWALAGDCRFDVELAAAKVDLWHLALTFQKGEHSGEPFQLERWQQAIVGNTFGWLRPDGTRRYRQVFIAVPRKMGKTPMAAGLALLLWVGEVEPGAEVISAASTREQARKVWEWASGMIRSSPELSDRIRIYQHSMVLKDDPLASYKPVAAEAGARHGDDLHGAIIDEVHTLSNRDLVDVIETSTAARRQPLIVMITTAGWDRESICWHKWEYAKKVCSGDIPDAAFLPVIYETANEADWTDEAVWRKANPNLGVSVKLEYLQAECEKAKKSPAYENTFRQLHLNQWTEQAVRFYPMAAWDKCEPRRPLEELENQECFGGLDLAEKRDLAALTLVFPDGVGGFDVRSWAWIPEDTARDKEKRDGVPYREWAKAGMVTLTPGDVIDYECVKRDIEEVYRMYRLQEIGFDRRFATQLTTQLASEFGILCVEVPQTFRHLSEPMKLSLELVNTGKLRHGGNRLLRWQASNTAVATDNYNEGLVRPYKAKSNGRIDGITAMVMALSRAIVNGNLKSYYAQGGDVFLL